MVTAASETKEGKMERNGPTYATFRCCDCEHTFPELLPPWCMELGVCPACGSGPVQLVELLERDSLKH